MNEHKVVYLASTDIRKTVHGVCERIEGRQHMIYGGLQGRQCMVCNRDIR